MLYAYRLVYPESPHAPPHLWEWKQPYIHPLVQNAKTFNRLVAQRYFPDWKLLSLENMLIWERHYQPYPLNADLKNW